MKTIRLSIFLYFGHQAGPSRLGEGGLRGLRFGFAPGLWKSLGGPAILHSLWCLHYLRLLDSLNMCLGRFKKNRRIFGVPQVVGP